MSTPSGAKAKAYKNDRLSGKDACLALMVVTAWGFNFIAIKYGVADFPPLWMTTLRFAVVSLLILPFAFPKREHLPTLLVLSTTLGGLHFGTLFIGFTGVDASSAAIAIQMGVPFSVLMGALAFKERISFRKTLGIFLAFAGAVILAGEPGESSLLHLGFILLAAFFWALSSALFKVLPPVPNRVYIGGVAFFAIPQTALASWIFESGQIEATMNASLLGWSGMIYTAIGGSIIGHGAWYSLAQRNDLSLVVPFTLLAPPIGIASAVIILGDTLTTEKIIGAVLTLLGVAIIQIGLPEFLKSKIP